MTIVQEVFPGKDGVTRAVKLKTAKSSLERPVQHLYPLELASKSIEAEAKPLNPEDFHSSLPLQKENCSRGQTSGFKRLQNLSINNFKKI